MEVFIGTSPTYKGYFFLASNIKYNTHQSENIIAERDD